MEQPPTHPPADVKGQIIWPRKGEGVYARFAALLIDVFPLLGIGGGLLYLYSESLGKISNYKDLVTRDGLGGLFGGIGLLIFPFTWLLYFTLMEGTFGASLGKLLTGLRVQRMDGGRCGYKGAFLRSLIGIFETNPIGMIAIWATPNNQRLGDLAGKTLVVNRSKIHLVSFGPEGALFTLQDGRMSDLATLRKAKITRAFNNRTMKLYGTTRDGRDNQINLPRQAFPSTAKMDRLQIDLEDHFKVEFQEVNRGWLALLAGVAMLIGIGLFLYYYIANNDGGLFNRQAEPPALAPLAAAARATPVREPTRLPTPFIPTVVVPTIAPTAAMVNVDFDTIKNYPAGQLVSIVGRMDFFSNTFCDNRTCSVLLENIDDSSQHMSIFVNAAAEGKNPEPNQMKRLMEGFREADVMIMAEDGVYAMVGYRIRVEGRVCDTTEGNKCVKSITSIKICTQAGGC